MLELQDSGPLDLVLKLRMISLKYFRYVVKILYIVTALTLFHEFGTLYPFT